MINVVAVIYIYSHLQENLKLMQLPSRYLLLITLLITSGCSTVIEGRSQNITINSSPQGAQCIVKQADDVVARLTTPGVATVEKSKNDLVILCSKDGYESVSVKNHSDLALSTFGNAAFYELSFVGNAIDSASGASNKYDSHMLITLAQAQTPAAFPAPPGALPVVELSPQVTTAMSMQVPMPPAPVTPVMATELPPAIPSTPLIASPAIADTSNPAVEASSVLGKETLKIAADQQPPQMTYAQAAEESMRRPPFE